MAGILIKGQSAVDFLKVCSLEPAGDNIHGELRFRGHDDHSSWSLLIQYSMLLLSADFPYEQNVIIS